MANNCGITFHMWFENVEEFNKFKKHYMPLIEESRKLHQGLSIAEGAVCLFDVCEDFDESHAMVSLYGWVKWGLCDEDAIIWFQELCKHYNIESSEIFYEEPGCCLYGAYSLVDGCLNDRYVPESEFPEYDDDNYWEELEAILQSDKAIDRIICKGFNKLKED